MKIIARVLVLLVACSVLPAMADDIAAGKSSINATFTQMGVGVTAKFNHFEGNIDYDPDKPAAATAHLTVQVASFDLGDPEYNKEVLKKDWFDTAQYPQATFVTTAIKPVAKDKLLATGKLTIKGKTLMVDVPMTVQRTGNDTTFSGSVPIKRLYFNIGEGEWRDTDMLADEVVIKFNVVTTH